MQKKRQSRSVALAFAAATPSLLSAAPVSAASQIPPTTPAIAAADAQARLLSALVSMTPAEKAVLASDRIPQADLIVIAAKNTAANCSNPCPNTKLLCPHKTTVPGHCPSTVTKLPKKV